ncbi:MAG: hypothetical protein Q8P21_01715 [bacterium]|nr:hypothetical protein [bacterium]
MGKAILTILILVLVAIGAYFMFGRGDDGLVLDGNNDATDGLTGTGGAEQGFDPLEGLDSTTDDEEVYPDKG